MHCGNFRVMIFVYLLLPFGLLRISMSWTVCLLSCCLSPLADFKMPTAFDALHPTTRNSGADFSTLEAESPGIYISGRKPLAMASLHIPMDQTLFHINREKYLECSTIFWSFDLSDSNVGCLLEDSTTYVCWLIYPNTDLCSVPASHNI